MKKVTIFCTAVSFTLTIHAQPSIQWQNCFGGTLTDQGNAIEQTTDGGYIVAGLSISTDGDVTGHHWNVSFIDNYDFWVLKLDNAGAVQWKKCLGGGGDENARAIQQTTDGGYIVAGDCSYDDDDVLGAHGNWDYWVVKLNDTGAIQWQKPLGGTNADWGKDVIQTSDGGYIVAGMAASNDGDVTGNHGGTDFWIVKLDGSGVIQWQKCYGGSGADDASCIMQTADGGYVVAGRTNSLNGDVTGHHGASNHDYWVIKISSSGTLQWQKCLGGTAADEANDIIQTVDGGYLVVGSSKSSDGDVSLNHGNSDYWIVRLDGTGALQWQAALGGSNGDIAYSCHQAAGGDFIVAGMSGSPDGDVAGSGSHGSGEYWIVRLDGLGNIIWKKCYGGSNVEWCYAINPAADGGYILNGMAHSVDGDVTGIHNGYDYWVVKLAPDFSGTGENAHDDALSLFPVPAGDMLFIRTTANWMTLKVYDALGKTVESITASEPAQTAKEFILDLKSLNQGIYWCRLVNEKGELLAMKKFAVVKD